MGNLFTVRLLNGLRRFLNALGGRYWKRRATAAPGAERDRRHARSR